VVVTHDMASAFRISDRIAMLANRQIIEIGTVAQMRASKNADVRAFFDAEA
jgi:phospholipid/cholesterol/gamma-HCH transport system ATP-binding protein